ncbi:MAG: hypothetical protein GVY16_03650 [Planctomycetes bacterium]|jgi:hypothetical protein|nr:hypothetical protein [Phycisphaerae bacterium]NBB94814.1 hypothetical protein [Planctomycetota bacterium]
MSDSSDNQFSRVVMELFDSASVDVPEIPLVTYIPEGDCIEFVFSGDNYYAERIDGLVTVYYSEANGEIVGSLIKGVRSFLQKVSQTLPSFRITIKDGTTKLEHIFLASLWAKEPNTDDVKTVRAYEKLIAEAENHQAEASLGEACFL